MALNNDLIEAFLSWKFITISKVASNDVLSLAKEGCNVLKLLNI